MATKVETIYYEIRGDAKALPRDVALAKTALSGVTREAQGSSVAVNQLRDSFKGLAAAAVSVKAVQLAKETVALADTYTTLEARLGLVTRDSAELARVQRELFQIAQDAKQPLENVSELYGRLSRASKELGASQEQVMRFTEGVGNALLVDKVAASQASGALLQLGQALGGGVIQAQEFNSLIDGTPRLLQAVADGLDKAHGSVAQLRKMVIAGEVSSKEFFDAFLKGSADLQVEARKMPETVGGAVTKLENAFLQFVGTSNKATGTTGEIVDAINALAENLDNVAKIGLTVGAVFGARFLSAGATNVAAMAAQQLKQRAATIASADAAAKAAIVNEAYAEDALRSAAASRQVAEAEVRQAAARLDEIAATQAAIVAERELQTVRLNSANVRGVRAANQLAQPGLSVLGGAVVAREQEALAAADAKRAAAQRELITLGNAQRGQAEREIVELAAAGKARGQLATAINAETTAQRTVAIATQASTAAQAAAARATSLLTGAFSIAARGARVFWTAIGGPIGAVLIGIYAVYSAIKRVEAETLAKAEARFASVQAKVADYAKTLADLNVTQLKVAESQERINAAQAATRAAEANRAYLDFKNNGASVNESTGGPAKLKKLRDEMLASIDAASVASGRVQAVVDAMQPSVNRTMSTIADKVDEAADKFRDLTKAARDFSDSLNEGDDPIGTTRAKIAALKSEIEKQIPLLKQAQQATARKDADTLFGQMDTELEQFEMSTLDDLNERLEKLNKQLEGDATAAAGDVFAELAKEARKLAADYKTANEEAKDPYVAQQAREKAQAALAAADAFDREGASAITAAREQKEYSDAIEVATLARQGMDAAYQGLVPNVKEYNRAIETLTLWETELRRRSNDTKLSWEDRKKAGDELLKVQAALNGTPVENGSAKQVEDTNLLAAALSIAASNAADLANNLGESGNKLAQLASIGIKVANVLKAVQAAQKAERAAEQSGDAMSTVDKFTNKSDWITLVITGVLEIANAFDLFGTKARKRAEELRRLAYEFNQSLTAFGRPLKYEGVSDLRRGQLDLQEETGRKVQDAAKLAGFNPEKAAGDYSAKRVRDYITKVEGEIQSLAADMSAENAARIQKLLVFRDALDEIAITAEKREEVLRKANDLKNADAINDQRVQQLVAQGRNEEADALRRKLELDRAIREAEKDTSESGKAYLRVLKQVGAEQEQAAQAALRDPLKEFQNRAKLFGLAGGEYLEGLMAASADKFTEIGTAISGLTLNTQDGIDALKQRGKDLYAQFKASDGFVSEAEQQILDALFNILTTAEDVFDSLSARVNRAMSRLSDDNEILGGDARTQFNRTVNASKGFNAVLDGILGNIDVSSSAGASVLRGRLQSLYVELLRDDLTADEEAIVGLIKGLLNGLSSAVEEAEQEIEAGFAGEVASRSSRRDRERRRVAIRDLEGAAAFANMLDALSPALASLFRTFNVSSLDGIDAAKFRLRELDETIEHLSDESALAQFGLTRTELIDAVTELDSSFDALKQSAQSAADAALALANRQRELSESAQDEFLRESGNDRQADLNAAKLATEKRVEEARAAGVSQSVIDQIVKTGELKLANINRRYDEQTASSAARELTPSVSSVTSAAPSSSFASSTISDGSMRVQTGVLQSSLLVQRRGVELQERLYALFAAGFPALGIPALPASVGGFISAGRQASGAGSSMNVNFNGDISVNGARYSPTDKRQLARELAPLISQEMRQYAARLTALNGGTR